MASLDLILERQNKVGVNFVKQYMKKYLIGSLIYITSSGLLLAQDRDFVNVPKPVLCGPLEKLFTILADKDINEKPIWLGKDIDDKMDYALFVNAETGSFTIVQFGKTMGCILGLGKQASPLRK